MEKEILDATISLIRVKRSTKDGLERLARADKRPLTEFLRIKFDEMVEKVDITPDVEKKVIEGEKE